MSILDQVMMITGVNVDPDQWHHISLLSYNYLSKPKCPCKFSGNACQWQLLFDDSFSRSKPMNLYEAGLTEVSTFVRFKWGPRMLSCNYHNAGPLRFIAIPRVRWTTHKHLFCQSWIKNRVQFSVHFSNNATENSGVTHILQGCSNNTGAIYDPVPVEQPW